MNGKRYLKNSNSSEISIKSTLGTVIFVKIDFQKSAHCSKNRKTKISHIFGTDRDISKIRKVLNSVYHEEQAVEVSRKPANFSFFYVKGPLAHSRQSKNAFFRGFSQKVAKTQF